MSHRNVTLSFFLEFCYNRRVLDVLSIDFLVKGVFRDDR